MTAAQTKLWTERLALPAYHVGEAARYARTSAVTVRAWQKEQGVLAGRKSGVALSYLQLIEVGVVAAMRQSGVAMRKIRQARQWLSDHFNSDYPFAQFRFKTDGKKLLMDYDQIIGPDGKEKLLSINEGGQLAWNEILRQRLQEFEYDTTLGTVLAWKVAGGDSPIRVDPRISFGAPQVNGIPTWVLRGRWESGESVADIAEDYGLDKQLVLSALLFEGVDVDLDRRNLWQH